MSIESTRQIERVVVLRALGLGDFLTGVPALRALRAACPRARIALAAPAALAPLARLCGAVDETADTAPLSPVAERLHGADLAVNLHGRGPQSTRLLLATRPRRLIAFAHDDVGETREQPRWRADEHEVMRWCRLLTEAGIPADPSPAGLALTQPAEATPWPGAIVVHPGAGAGARRWPPSRWAQVAGKLAHGSHPVLVTGNAAERSLAAFVAGAAGLPSASVLAGQLDLLELARLTADAALVLSGDTGMAHLAAAFATPAVTLAGPIPPALWGPPPQPWHRVLWHRVPRPGDADQPVGDPHAATPDPRLLAITTAEVITAAHDVLGRFRAPELAPRSAGAAGRRVGQSPRLAGTGGVGPRL